jgi:hypothetical protein
MPGSRSSSECARYRFLFAYSCLGTRFCEAMLFGPCRVWLAMRYEAELRNEALTSLRGPHFVTT